MFAFITNFFERRRLRDLQSQKYDLQRRLQYLQSKPLTEVEYANMQSSAEMLRQVNEQIDLYNDGDPVKLKRVP